VAFISKDLRVNKEIRAKQVRIIGHEGEQLGIMAIREALDLSEEKELDLASSNTNRPRKRETPRSSARSWR